MKSKLMVIIFVLVITFITFVGCENTRSYNTMLTVEGNTETINTEVEKINGINSYQEKMNDIDRLKDSLNEKTDLNYLSVFKNHIGNGVAMKEINESFQFDSIMEYSEDIYTGTIYIEADIAIDESMHCIVQLIIDNTDINGGLIQVSCYDEYALSNIYKFDEYYISFIFLYNSESDDPLLSEVEHDFIQDFTKILNDIKGM